MSDEVWVPLIVALVGGFSWLVYEAKGRLDFVCRIIAAAGVIFGGVLLAVLQTQGRDIGIVHDAATLTSDQKSPLIQAMIDRGPSARFVFTGLALGAYFFLLPILINASRPRN